jgi:hypothetical protein
MGAGHKPATGETGRESAEVAEAIKALQTQLADLRKIVQAAKSSEDISAIPERRQ